MSYPHDITQEPQVLGTSLSVYKLELLTVASCSSVHPICWCEFLEDLVAWVCIPILCATCQFVLQWLDYIVNATHAHNWTISVLCNVS